MFLSVAKNTTLAGWTIFILYDFISGSRRSFWLAENVASTIKWCNWSYLEMISDWSIWNEKHCTACFVIGTVRCLLKVISGWVDLKSIVKDSFRSCLVMVPSIKRQHWCFTPISISLFQGLDKFRNRRVSRSILTPESWSRVTKYLKFVVRRCAL